jgi:hypothetical protein
MPSARALRCNSVHPRAITLRDFHFDPYRFCLPKVSAHPDSYRTKAARYHENPSLPERIMNVIWY